MTDKVLPSLVSPPEIQAAEDAPDYFYMTISDHMNGGFEMRVRILTTSSFSDLKDYLGDSLEVNIRNEETETDCFYGGTIFEVHDCGYFAESFVESLQIVEFVVRPAFWRAALARQSGLYEEMTATDVVERVHGQVNGVGKIQVDAASSITREQILQYQETGLDFMRRLLQRDAISYWFKYADNGRHDLVLLTDLSSVSGGTHELGGQYEKLTDAANSARIQITATGTDDYDHRNPNANLHKSAQASDSFGESISEEIYPGGYWDQSDGGTDEIAKTLQAGTDGDAGRSEVVCDRFEVRTGDEVKIANVFSNGELSFRVVGQELTYDGRKGARASNATIRNRLILQDLQSEIAPSRVLADPPNLGMTIGKVVDDPSSDPLKLGRVSVQLQVKQAGTTSSVVIWCHMMRPWAGPERGIQFDHLVGDEVVLAFLHGDPDRPVVVGALHNSEAVMPYEIAREGEGRIAGIKTPSGNELSFNDDSGEERIHVFAQKDLAIETTDITSMESGGDTTIKATGNIEVTGEADIITTATGNIEVTGEADITTTASGAVKIEATDSIELVVGQSSIKIEQTKITLAALEIVGDADASLEMTSGGTAKVEGSGTLTLEGGVVMIN